MGADSKIEWTDATWPVVKGCDYVSPGCANCYAADLIHRHARHPNPKISLPLAGLTEVKGDRPRWTGKVYLNEPHLRDPLKWKTGRMIFVPSHGDLFHDDVPDSYIDRVFAVMAICHQHTFQVLTKRPGRMAAYLAGCVVGERKLKGELSAAVRDVLGNVFDCDIGGPNGFHRFSLGFGSWPWPLPNVWLGTSVENQAAANERIPQLLRTPAAVRFLSCEPLLGPVSLTPWLDPTGVTCGAEAEVQCRCRGCVHARTFPRDDDGQFAALDWVILGGESGPHARPCNVEWVRDLVRQCRAAGVAAFVKQLGAVIEARGAFDPIDQFPGKVSLRQGRDEFTALVTLGDKKGGDPAEWPSDLRVREFPNPAGRAA